MLVLSSWDLNKSLVCTPLVFQSDDCVWGKCGVGSQEPSVISVSLSDLAQLPFRSDFICGTCLLTPAETQLSAETEKG